MTRLMAVTMAMLVAAGSAVPVVALERGPVCREPTVIEEMAREVRSRSYYSVVDHTLVTEQPTADPLVVRCQVCVQLAPFDTLRFANHPIEQCLPHGFDVQILPTGFVVHDLG